MLHRSLFFTAATSLALTGLATPLAAQEGASSQDYQLDEIIVSARKRQESVLKVPVVTTVLTSAQLERNQVSNITDVATLTPGLMLGQQSLEIGTQVSIRGVGTTALDPGIDQSVSLNIDGLQVTQGAAYSVGVFDMQQIEVLKGPQALFFGKNSPGGVIAIRSADPTDEVEVKGRIGYEFRAREARGEIIMSGPVTETLGLRLATQYSDFGGYFKNTATAVPAFGGVQPASRFGKSTTLLMRGTALYRPTSDFTARLKLNYTRDRQTGGASFQLKSCPDGLVNYTGIPFYSANEDCKVDGRLNLVDLDPAAFAGLRNNGKPFINITQKFGTLDLSYDFESGLNLTSVTGYYNLFADVMQNGTLTGGAATPLVADKKFRRKEFTQEFRLASDFGGPANFTLGAFYQNGKMTNDIVLAGNTLVGLPPRLAVGTHDVDIDSFSAFGQLQYELLPTVEIAGGARWTYEKRTDDPTTIDLFGAFSGVAGSTVVPVVPTVKSKNWSPELTLTWTPTDDLTIFGSLKQGYKSGSFNLIVPVNPGENNSFGDEKVRGGEVGLKARLADRRIFANLAFYHYKYQGLQVGVNEVAAGGLPVLRTVNAGSAKVYGVDFDISYRPPVDGLNLRASANWNHARFADFVGAPCYGGQTIQEGCNLVPNPAATDPVTGLPLFTAQDLTGNPLTRAPDWQATLGFDYEMPVGGDTTLTFGMDGQYSSKYVTILGRRDDFYQKAFAKLNANVSLQGPNEAWEVSLIGNNLTNKLTTGSCTNLNYAGGQILPGIISGASVKGPGGSDEVICTFDRGREIWLRLTLRPGEIFGRGR